jgi:transcriptional regulator with XRE-family HTH domain
LTPRRTDLSGRDELSRLLIVARGERSQAQAARLTGLSQAKVTRAERGRFPMSLDEATHYATALGASAEQLERVKQLAETKVAEHVRGRVSLVRVAAAIQERYDQLEADATLIQGWQPGAIHGVLQAPTYTATLLAGHGDGDPGPAWWAARGDRTAKLAQPGRDWHLLMSESALRWPLGSAEVMREQLAHLASVSRLPNVRLGVLDLRTPKPFPPPAGFQMFDRAIATAATEIGTSFIAAAEDLDHFARLFDQLHEHALFDDDARDLFAQVSAAYQE